MVLIFFPFLCSQQSYVNLHFKSRTGFLLGKNNLKAHLAFDTRKSGMRHIMQSGISNTVYHTGRSRVPLQDCNQLLHETLKILN